MSMRRSLSLLAALHVAAAAPAQSARLDVVAAAIVDACAPRADDTDAIATRLLTAARGVSSSPVSSIAIDLAARHVGRFEAPLEVVRLLDEFLASSPHGLGAQSARVLRERVLLRLGRREEARSVPAWDGFASHFVVVGPFGDEGDSFAGVPFPPELEFPHSGRPLAGRFGPVSTRVVRRKSHERGISLRRDERPDRGGCFYALHQVRTSSPTACYAEIVTDGSFELFVNGAPHARVFRPEARRSDRHYVPIRLVNGNNHVLLKSTDVRVGAISLRYVDARGDAVALAELTSHEPLPRSTGDLPPELGPFVDDCRVLDNAIGDADERRDLLAIATMMTCFERGHTERALELLATFEARIPNETALRLALVAAWDRASALPPEVRRARAQALFESIGDAFDDHHFATVRRASLLADEDKREDAIRLLEARLARHPSEAATYDALYDLLRDLRFRAEATRLAERWLERIPLDDRPVLILASERARGGDLRAALDIVLTALDREPGARALLRRALDLAVDLGDHQIRDRTLAALYVDDPGGLAAHRARADALLASGEEAAGLDAFAQVAEHPEATAATVVAAATLLETRGRREAAVAAFERALAIDPQRHETRRTLTHLGDRVDEEFPLIARFRRDGDAARAAFAYDETREQGASSTLVVDQMIVRFYSDGSSVSETHVLRRVNDLRGVETFSDASEAANADEVVRIRTIAPDGRSWVPNRVRGSFSMPRLEPGAFVEQVTRNFKSAPGESPWRAPSFLFRSPNEPYLLTEYIVILPPEHPGTFRVRRFEGEREQHDLPGGYTAHVFRDTDVSRLETESLTPPLQDLVAFAGYGADRALAAQARENWARVRRATRPSPWVVRATHEVLADTEGDTARANAIYDWVHGHVPGGRGTADATGILLRRQGPRFFLFVSMLRVAEIPFRHAIAQPATENLLGDPTPLFLGDEEFPVAAVRVAPRDGAPLWVFVDNARYQPIGTIPPERFGAAALMLDLGAHELVRLPGGNRDAALGWRFRGAIALDGEGSARFEVTAEKLGDTGYSLASRVRDLPEEHRGIVARQIASQFMPGWTVVASRVDGLEPGERLTARTEVQRTRALQQVGDELLMSQPLPPLQLVARFADRPARVLPLKITDMEADDTEITIDPGSSLCLTRVPDPVEIHGELLDFSLSFGTRDGMLVMRRRLSLRPGTIAPGNYADWQRMLRVADAAEEVKLRFRKL